MPTVKALKVYGRETVSTLVVTSCKCLTKTYMCIYFPQVIVIDASFPTAFNSETLYGHEQALEEELTYWVAAELPPSRLQVGMSAKVFHIRTS